MRPLHNGIHEVLKQLNSKKSSELNRKLTPNEAVQSHFKSRNFGILHETSSVSNRTGLIRLDPVI